MALRPGRRATSLLVCLVAAGCLEDTAAPDGAAVCAAEEVRIGVLRGRVPVDLLIVVDRTPSAADNAGDFARQLTHLPEGLAPDGRADHDLHIAVITSDLGAAGVPGCDAAGDRGVFQRAAACGLDGAFLRDLRAGNDTDRTRNYPGSLADALTCLLDLPLSSCPVNQPLGAATRALGGVAGNDGFRRPDAHLYVIVLSDGDDCSLVDPDALAGPFGGDVEATVDFRCFARGVTCTPADPAAPGAHTACAPRDDGGLVGVDRTAAFLDNDASAATFFVVAGGADATVLGPDRLAPSCTADGAVGPAPRLAALVRPPRRGRALDACWPTPWTGWEPIEPLIAGGPTCFDDVLDREPLVPGLQADCTAAVLDHRDGGDGDEVAPLRFCSDPARPPDAPCMRWVDDPRSCPAGDALAIDPNGARAYTFARIRCAAPCDAGAISR